MRTSLCSLGFKLFLCSALWHPWCGTASWAVDGQRPAEARNSADPSGQLSQDRRFWAFHEWYSRHSVLNLIVSGSDLRHLAKSLEELLVMQKRGVLIGDLAIIGAELDPSTGAAGVLKTGASRERATQAELVKQLLEKLGERSVQFVPGEALLKRYSVSNSPVWVVRHQGKDYVYEGLSSPARLFTSQGVFHAR